MPLLMYIVFNIFSSSFHESPSFGLVLILVSLVRANITEIFRKLSLDFNRAVARKKF